ncbi:hypothetical protein [Leuconostoc pseudomesenteroides]
MSKVALKKARFTDLRNWSKVLSFMKVVQIISLRIVEIALIVVCEF